MILLRQPKGDRIIEVETEQEADYCRAKGFRDVTEKDAAGYLAMRQERFEKAHYTLPDDHLDVYFATVHRRGDGYGMSSHHLKQELLEHKVHLMDDFHGQKIGILYHRPYGVTQLNNDVKVIFSMFESDKLPPDWKEFCDFADRVIVPSRWCQKIFAEAGIKTDVIPLGYDSDTFKFIDRPIPSEKAQPFTFLHYNAFNVRKGFTEVLKAFLRAFPPGKSMAAKLILKTTLDTIPLPLPKSEYPNIEVITGECSPEELASIMERSHAFIFPSRGEGFGITPLEAMATGMPAIVPNAHGISEYFHPEFMYEVPVKSHCPGLYHSYKGQDVGNMVICDYVKLSEQMLYLYRHQEEAKAKGIAAAQYVQAFTYKQSARKMANYLKELDKEKLIKRSDSDILRVTKI